MDNTMSNSAEGPLLVCCGAEGEVVEEEEEEAVEQALTSKSWSLGRGDGEASPLVPSSPSLLVTLSHIARCSFE